MMEPKFSRHALAIFSVCIPFAVTAQTTPEVPRLDNIIVTASRTAQLEKDVLGDVTVVDKKELERAGQSSLAEVLSRHHGVEFTDSGGPQTVTSIFLRGANASQTLVLLDGVPINGATSGLSALNAIPASSIERVEILRGSASSLYGANAIGGVINIITSQTSDKPLSAHASAGLGTYGTSKYNASIAGQSDGWTYSLGSSYEQSRGFDATNESVSFNAHDPDNDSYYIRNLRGSLGYEWKKGQKLRLQAYNTRVNGGIDANQGVPFNDRSIQTLEMYSVASENQLTDYWKSTLRYAYTDDKNQTRSAFDNSVFSARQNQYTWQNEFNLSDTQKLVVAYEHLNQEASLSPGSNFTQTKRHNNAFTGVYTGDFSRHHVQASLRNDHNSQFGDATTGGLSYGYDLTSEFRGHIAANTGFKIPTFNDLYFPAFPGFPATANPNLRPEKSRNVELGLDYTSDKTKLGVVVYQNKVHDLITLDSNFVPQNVDRATLRGITLTAEQGYGNTTVRASADFQDPHNDANSNQLSRRARQIYRLSADHRLDQWTVGTEYTFVGKRYDDAANQISLGGYSLWNLTAGYDFNKNLGVQARWNNVLNKEYTNAFGYNKPGSNVFVNLTWRM